MLHPIHRRATSALVLAAAGAFAPHIARAQAAVATRPMTFLDMQYQRSFGAPAPSPDGKWLLHTVTTPDWQNARSQTDIHLVSVAGGVSTSRRLTYTNERNETAPAWTRDGKQFAFLSNRDSSATASGDQLYLMQPDGGEARRVTSAAGGVSDFEFTRDGRWVLYRA